MEIRIPTLSGRYVGKFGLSQWKNLDVLEDKTLQWPAKFTHYPKTRPLNLTDDILNALSIREPAALS